MSMLLLQGLKNVYFLGKEEVLMISGGRLNWRLCMFPTFRVLWRSCFADMGGAVCREHVHNHMAHAALLLHLELLAKHELLGDFLLEGH